MDIKTLTSKKVAGIPVIYIVLVVAIAGLYGAFKLKPSAPDAEMPSDETGSDVAGDAAVDTSQPVFTATPTLTQTSGVASIGSVTSTPGADTDDLWKRRAIEYLRQHGYTLDVSTTAINKYLNGEILSVAEAGARDMAVQQFGLPPEAIPGTATEPTAPTNLPSSPQYTGPASKQGTPPCTHIVRGTSDDSYGELALMYYNGTGGGEINFLKAWNYANEPFAQGTQITIPKLVEPKYYVATSATRTLAGIAKKNGISQRVLQDFNPSKQFPVNAGVTVRVR